MNEEQLLSNDYRKYSGKEVDVYFNKDICIHAARCVKGNLEVFNTKRRPWILPDNASAAEVGEVIDTCPSGALKYIYHGKTEALPLKPADDYKGEKEMEYQFIEEEKRFVVQDSQGKEIGEITYVKSGRDKLIIDHTGVENDHRGQGLAEELVRRVVEKAKNEGLKIIPLCPFAKKEFDIKAEYKEVRHK